MPPCIAPAQAWAEASGGCARSASNGAAARAARRVISLNNAGGCKAAGVIASCGGTAAHARSDVVMHFCRCCSALGWAYEHDEAGHLYDSFDQASVSASLPHSQHRRTWPTINAGGPTSPQLLTRPSPYMRRPLTPCEPHHGTSPTMRTAPSARMSTITAHTLCNATHAPPTNALPRSVITSRHSPSQSITNTLHDSHHSPTAHESHPRLQGGCRRLGSLQIFDIQERASTHLFLDDDVEDTSAISDGASQHGGPPSHNERRRAPKRHRRAAPITAATTPGVMKTLRYHAKPTTDTSSWCTM